MTRPSRSNPSAPPLKPIDFHVLLVLVEGPLHGYGIVKEIEARSQGRIRLQPGNLYRYIRRLVDEELVAPAARAPAGASDDEGGEADGEAVRRRYYEITPSGRRALADETARMRMLVAVAESRLGAES